MSLERLNAIPDSVYEAVAAMPGAGLYHGKAWHGVLREALGWQVEAFIARKGDGGLRFFLPFVEKRSMTLTRARVALPLSHLVRPLGTLKPGEDASLAGLFIHAPVEGQSQDISRTRTVLDLSVATDAVGLAREVRSAIQRKFKKAVKEGYVAVETRQADHVAAFTAMQAETRRRQGSPTFPSRFFQIMADRLGELFHLHMVLSATGEPVAAVIFIDDGHTSLYGYGASLDRREIWQDGVNQLAMWEAILAAHRRGQHAVDFGSTPKLLSELIHYKEKWGGVTEDLPYTRIGSTASGQPDRGSPLVRLSSEVLKRMPLPLFRAISPTLLKLAA